MIVEFLKLFKHNEISNMNRSDWYWYLCFQVSSLIAELASAAAAEKGIVFEEAIEERLCAYSRAVAHFPTAVKEVNAFFSHTFEAFSPISSILIWLVDAK